MTRRNFITNLTGAAVAIFAGVSSLARKGPRKFVRAFRIRKYPGVLKPLEDISGPSKWSG
ncbi:MAG: twin-arginine translocation signal domain-containing protein [Phycisphaerales bacterium]|nr:MAG: twin-arginine translocation signal domain-containing protein [Phycisphaerales bacterium]